MCVAEAATPIAVQAVVSGVVSAGVLAVEGGGNPRWPTEVAHGLQDTPSILNDDHRNVVPRVDAGIVLFGLLAP